MLQSTAWERGETDDTASIEAADLENMERQLIGALKAVWRAQGKRCKIVRVQGPVYEIKAG